MKYPAATFDKLTSGATGYPTDVMPVKTGIQKSILGSLFRGNDK